MASRFAENVEAQTLKMCKKMAAKLSIGVVSGVEIAVKKVAASACKKQTKELEK